MLSESAIEVVPCGLVEVNIRAKIILMASTPPEILNTIRQSFVSAFNKIAGLGVSISRAWIISNLFLNGVKDVELQALAEDVLVTEIDCAKPGILELTR
jgi:phage-related baseplate assembly protein